MTELKTAILDFFGFTTQPIKYFSISQGHLFCRIPRILQSGTQVKQTNKSPWLELSTGTNGLVPQERQHRIQSLVLLKHTNCYLFSYPSTLKKGRKDSKKVAHLCRKTAGLWVGELLGRIDQALYRPCSMSSSHPGTTQDPSNAAAAASHLLTSLGPLHTDWPLHITSQTDKTPKTRA